MRREKGKSDEKVRKNYRFPIYLTHENVAKPATDDAKDELLAPFRRLYALTRDTYPALANAALLAIRLRVLVPKL
ncbi:CIC_collapsed_G0027250.mRNA.1.CDS.1 [Saccharomyces cerevisiae]|nr:CIC_collapsed_G0027250.mRNA.1.CDS.1 [Saccharomyces cerevisiae]